MSSLIDISVLVSPATPEWPGDTPFSCGWSWDMAAGASVNVSRLTMSPHIGTHADAPLHVSPHAPGADMLALDAFCGPAVVVDVSQHHGEISFDAFIEALHTLLGATPPLRLLLKTGHTITDGRFPKRWPWLAHACIDILLARGLLLLGVDCPSVDDRDSKTLDTHHSLFRAGANVLENLDLRLVSAGRYELIAFPTKFANLDAAPVRAVLRPARE